MIDIGKIRAIYNLNAHIWKKTSNLEISFLQLVADWSDALSMVKSGQWLHTIW